MLHERDRAGVHLVCFDLGGEGPCVMLLHGLCGYAFEWRDTALWLADNGFRVLLPDQRGHGGSERRPADLSRRAFVGDAEMWLTTLAVTPVALVGHSLGGHTAFLLASQRPDLVRSLVVVEASPQADASPLPRLERWLERWPRPFPSRQAALKFFGGDTAYARAWSDGLERRADGLWPCFDTDIMLRTLSECREQGYWNEWATITCPTLLVRGSQGVEPVLTRRMCELAPATRVVSVQSAAHDLHLEAPDEWRSCVGSFLGELA